MTAKDAAIKLAEYHNTKKDPIVEQVNIARYMNFGGPLASYADKDEMAQAYEAELEAIVLRGDAA